MTDHDEIADGFNKYYANQECFKTWHYATTPLLIFERKFGHAFQRLRRF